MCCIKVLGTMEITFRKELLKEFKGSMFTLQLATHNGQPIGLGSYDEKLWGNTVIVTFDKPKEGCCSKE